MWKRSSARVWNAFLSGFRKTHFSEYFSNHVLNSLFYPDFNWKSGSDFPLPPDGNGREPGKRFPDQRGTGGNPEMNSDSGQGTGQINGLTNALVLSDPLEKIPGRKWKGHIILNHQKWFGTHSTRASKIGLWYAPYIGRLSDFYKGSNRNQNSHYV